MVEKKKAPNPIDFEELMDAYFFVGGSQSDENYAWIERETGEIHYYSTLDPDSYDDEDDPENREGDALDIPDQYDLDLGQDLVFRFVSDRMPEDYNRVQDFFSHRGAYSRYKDLLADRGLLDAWHKYEDDETRKALRQWCEDNGLDITESRKDGPPDGIEQD